MSLAKSILGTATVLNRFLNDNFNSLSQHEVFAFREHLRGIETLARQVELRQIYGDLYPLYLMVMDRCKKSYEDAKFVTQTTFLAVLRELNEELVLSDKQHHALVIMFEDINAAKEGEREDDESTPRYNGMYGATYLESLHDCLDAIKNIGVRPAVVSNTLVKPAKRFQSKKKVILDGAEKPLGKKRAVTTSPNVGKKRGNSAANSVHL